MIKAVLWGGNWPCVGVWGWETGDRLEPVAMTLLRDDDSQQGRYKKC